MNSFRLTFVHSVLMAATGGAVALPPPLPPSSKDLVVTRHEPAKKSLAKMVFDRTSHDFGKMFDDKKHQTTFSFTNTGSETLEILTLRADCGCTVPELEKRRYEPGESGQIEVTFDPDGRSGKGTRAIEILSNDGDQSTITLSVLAEITPIVSVSPKVLTVGAPAKGGTTTRSVQVSGIAEKFEVTGAVVRTDEQFSVEVREAHWHTDRFGKQIRRSTIDVTFQSDGRVGDFSAQLEITTNDPRRPTMRSQLIARVHGDLYTQPRLLGMGRTQVGAEVKRETVVQSRSNEPFRILKAEFGEGNYKGRITFVPVDPKNPVEWKVTVVGQSSYTESRLDQQIVLTTDVDQQETFRIPLRGAVIDGQ